MKSIILPLLAVCLFLPSARMAAQGSANGCRPESSRQTSVRPIIYTIASGTRCHWTPRELRHLRGDSEFRGNGPDISVTAHLTRIAATQVRLVLSIKAEETPIGSRGRRHTVIDGTSPVAGYVIFTAPKGFRVRDARPRAKEFHIYVDRDPAVDIVRPACVHHTGCLTRDVRSKTIDPTARRSNTSNVGLVDTWMITGDTRGDDFGKTGVEAVLGTVIVELEPEK